MYTLTVYRDELIAGGGFWESGSTDVPAVARWDGEEWSPLGSGGLQPNNSVWGLTVYAGNLVPGGSFSTAGGYVSAHWARWGRACPLGDLNGDGEVDPLDINPFALALANPSAYHTALPECDIDRADVHDDGEVDFGDINPFVVLLSSGG